MLRHQVGEVGLHPFARLVAGALPAERPVVDPPARPRGDGVGGRAELGEVVRLLVGDSARQAVGGQQDRPSRRARRPAAPRAPRGSDRPARRRRPARRARRPATLTSGATSPDRRPRRLDRRGVAAHQQRRVLRREDDRGDAGRRLRRPARAGRRRSTAPRSASRPRPASPRLRAERGGLAARDLDQRRATDDPVAAGELVDELRRPARARRGRGPGRRGCRRARASRASRRSSAGRRSARRRSRRSPAAAGATLGCLLVDEVDQPAEDVRVGLGQDAVAEVEDVARPTGGLVEDAPCARRGSHPSRPAAGPRRGCPGRRARARPGARRRRARRRGRRR